MRAASSTAREARCGAVRSPTTRDTNLTIHVSPFTPSPPASMVKYSHDAGPRPATLSHAALGVAAADVMNSLRRSSAVETPTPRRAAAPAATALVLSSFVPGRVRDF